MKNILIRLKLIDTMTTTLPTSKVEFVNRLNEITDEGSTGMLSDSFDVFSSSKNEFKGQVNIDSFKIKRRRRFFDTNMNFAVANGTFIENNGQLTVETEINGFNNFFILFYVALILFYSIAFFGPSFNSVNGDYFAIPFLLLHGTFMFALPYFMMRRSVKRLKYELEREFFYLTKK
ncbi:MAG: hypothetical protein JST62_10085 [Bacteroidetes bacterium]|nr:hypothetical protein [Bacteroidota bacterium]